MQSWEHQWSEKNTLHWIPLWNWIELRWGWWRFDLQIFITIIIKNPQTTNHYWILMPRFLPSESDKRFLLKIIQSKHKWVLLKSSQKYVEHTIPWSSAYKYSGSDFGGTVTQIKLMMDSTEVNPFGQGNGGTQEGPVSLFSIAKQ